MATTTTTGSRLYGDDHNRALQVLRGFARGDAFQAHPAIDRIDLVDGCSVTFAPTHVTLWSPDGERVASRQDGVVVLYGDDCGHSASWRRAALGFQAYSLKAPYACRIRSNTGR